MTRSMAAAGAILGGTSNHIEFAAEIGAEHELGPTGDPVFRLVQGPCVERNAVGAMKAVRPARPGDGTHRVSIDEVIRTMRRTGAGMHERCKELSLGGVAFNIVKC